MNIKRVKRDQQSRPTMEALEQRLLLAGQEI